MANKNQTLGILSLILSLVGLLFGFALPLGIAAIILGAVETPKTPFGIAGIIVGIVDVVIILAYLGSY